MAGQNHPSLLHHASPGSCRPLLACVDDKTMADIIITTFFMILSCMILSLPGRRLRYLPFGGFRAGGSSHLRPKERAYRSSSSWCG